MISSTEIRKAKDERPRCAVRPVTDTYFATPEQALEEDAQMWSFILWQTGDPEFQPRN